MENLFGLFRRRREPQTADTKPSTDPPPATSISEPQIIKDDPAKRREELSTLRTRLKETGYDLGVLEDLFDRTVVGTTNADVFRYIQLISEFGFSSPVAVVSLDEDFSGRKAIQSIIDQVTRDSTPVSDAYWSDLHKRITEPYTLAVSVAPGLQPTGDINSFSNMFRSSNSAEKTRGVVLYQNQKDVPREIARNIYYIPTPKT